MNKRLKEVRKEIGGKIKKKELWLFWDKEIEWDGKIRVAFIGLNPTEGKRPGNLEAFKKILDHHGFSGAFVTDLIKIRNKRPDDNFWNTIHAEILKKEIEVVKPYFVIAIGKEVESVLRNPKYNLGVPVEKIRHYTRTNRDELNKDIERIAKKYRNLAKQQRA